jgi:hypothetical protein
MKRLSDMAKRISIHIQPTNILLCLIYVALLLTLYLDLYVWRPN